MQEVHDATSSNPLSVRDGAETSTTQRTPLQNVKRLQEQQLRTIWKTSRKQELLDSMFEQEIDILGIQEHRIVFNRVIVVTRM